jgi:hypothetical protein
MVSRTDAALRQAYITSMREMFGELAQATGRAAEQWTMIVADLGRDDPSDGMVDPHRPAPRI